jgi:predicted CXXCH cytochrome family protein
MKVALPAPAIGLAIIFALSSYAPARAEQCGLCHPEQRVAFADSVHANEEVGCVDCHRGDAETKDPERAHRGSFRSLADRLRVPAACAECHSDLERMRPYNLPVDQYAVYLTSKHGQAATRGERRAAVCTDCHGSHDIRSSEDPASSLYPTNLPATCGSCHAEEALTDAFGLDPTVVAEYRSGVHGVSLLEKGNAAAPNCTSCHGVHGAAPPGVGNVDKVCGSCHQQTRQAFLAGPHYRGMLDAGLPECASCHSNHEVRRFGAGEIETLCADCHGSGAEQARLGQKIYTLIGSAAEEVDKAEELALEAQGLAMHVEDHFGRVEEARTYLTEALLLVHSVELEPVDELSRRARSIGEEVRHEIYRDLDRRPAHIGLVVFWFYVLMTLAVVMAYKRRLVADEHR